MVEKPNDWTKEIKRNTSNSPTLQVGYDHWMTMSVGYSACHIIINQIRKDNQIVVEWYISDDKELFHKFHSHKTVQKQI